MKLDWADKEARGILKRVENNIGYDLADEIAQALRDERDLNAYIAESYGSGRGEEIASWIRREVDNFS